MRRLFPPVLLASLLLVPSSADANGRFPAANQLVAGPSRLLVRTTFGLLLSDQPGSFSWVCEQSFGFGDEQDPPVALSSQQRVLVAPFQGPRRSSPEACSFDLGGGIPAGELLLDVSTERSDPARAVALSWSQKTKRASVFASVDGGAVWNLRGSPPETDGIPTTLDVAPSMPQRVVLAGSFSAGGKLLGYVSRSDDDTTWSRAEVPLIDGENGLYLSAIDPENPDLLYARTSGGAQDRLLVSADGGATFSELTRVDGAMLGFALSPDGGQVAVGGPGGVLVAPRGSGAFQQIRSGATSCLAWSMDGLHACGSGLAGDFVVGRTTDGGKSWTPVLAALKDVQGPTPRCEAGSAVATTCEPLWPAQQQLLNSIGSAGGGAGAAGTGSLGGGAGAGGASAGSGGNGGAASGGRAGVAAPEGEGSCGCRAVGGGAEAGGWVTAALLLCRRWRTRRRSTLS